jgi:hypothetical protein
LSQLGIRRIDAGQERSDLIAVDLDGTLIGMDGG